MECRGVTPPLCAAPVHSSSPPAPRGPRSSRVVLSRPSSLPDLIRQSGGLRALSRHPPVMGPVPDIHWIILSVLLTFRTFTAALSRIAAFNTPEAPLRAPQFFRNGSGHRVQARPLAAPIPPPISSLRDSLFDASSVRSRYGPPACSPPGLTGPARSFDHPSPQDFYFRAFRRSGHPKHLPDIATTPF